MSSTGSSSSSSDDIPSPDDILKQYQNFHIEMPYQVGIGKIYDPYLIEAQKSEDYFKKEYELKATGVGSRVFKENDLQRSIALGEQYDPDKIDVFSEKYLCCDPAFYGSKFGIVICELVDGNIRVLFAEHFERPNTQKIIDIILEMRGKYRNIKNILIDASQVEFIIDLKYYFESLGNEYANSYNEKIREWKKFDKEPWEMGMYIIPVPFNKRVELTQRLKRAMTLGNYWINSKFDKLLLAYETAIQKDNDENDIDKDNTENNDILDAQLCLFRKLKVL